MEAYSIPFFLEQTGTQRYSHAIVSYAMKLGSLLTSEVQSQHFSVKTFQLHSSKRANFHFQPNKQARSPTQLTSVLQEHT